MTGTKPLLCAFALAMASTAAQAATADLPATTKEFIVGCETNAKQCRDWLALISFKVTYEGIATGERSKICTSYYDEVLNASMLEILKRAKAEPKLSEKETAASISPLLKAVRPVTDACLNAEDDALPKTTAAFVSYCASEPKDAKTTCDDVADAVAATAITRGKTPFCMPHGAKDYTSKVRKWLAGQSNLGNQARNKSILAGYNAVYPCTE
jgi:hypothetical protein